MNCYVSFILIETCGKGHGRKEPEPKSYEQCSIMKKLAKIHFIGLSKEIEYERQRSCLVGDAQSNHHHDFE